MTGLKSAEVCASAGELHRPNCLNRDACVAAKPTSHCRRCVMAKLNSDPALMEKKRASLRRHFALPETAAAAGERLNAARVARMERDPEFRAWASEHGRRQYEQVLNRPDVRAKTEAPDVRARAGRKSSETRLSWCPADLREEYRFLVYSQRVPATEARTMIEATVAKRQLEAERALAEAERRKTPFERQMERVRAGARLVERVAIPTAQHGFTLGGVAEAAF